MSLSPSSYSVVSRRCPLGWVYSELWENKCGSMLDLVKSYNILDVWELRKVRLYGGPSGRRSRSSTLFEAATVASLSFRLANRVSQLSVMTIELCEKSYIFFRCRYTWCALLFRLLASGSEQRI